MDFLVENAIKHGISTLAKGGELNLSAEIINEKLEVTLVNNGQLSPNFMERLNTFGLANTQQRLHLLYGKDARTPWLGQIQSCCGSIRGWTP